MYVMTLPRAQMAGAASMRDRPHAGTMWHTVFGFALSREWRVYSAHAILRTVGGAENQLYPQGAGVIEGRSVGTVGGRRAVLQVAVCGRLTFVPLSLTIIVQKRGPIECLGW